MMNRNDSFRPDPYVTETTKVAELKDHFGNTRFKVSLTDFDGPVPQHDDLASFDRQFQVIVVSYCYSEDAVTVVCREFDMYEKAVRFFRDMVSQYSALVKAETRDYQDIGIYAGKTGYRKICPDCCATCRWAKPIGKDNCLFEDWKKNHRGRFLCMNAELYAPPRRDLRPDDGRHDGYHDFAEPRFHVVDIHPEVDFDGICDGFERRADMKYKDPKHSMWTFQNHDITDEMAVDTMIKSKVSEYVDGSLDTVIIPGVGKAIDDKLNNNPPIIEGNRQLNNDMVLDGGGA